MLRSAHTAPLSPKSNSRVRISKPWGAPDRRLRTRFFPVNGWTSGMASDSAEQAIAPESRTKIFISYSRTDVAFADRIEAALEDRGFEPLIDRRDIAKLEDWWKRIEQLIIRSDTVIFVISPDAVKSTSVCQREVVFAQTLNKRLAPILWRATDTALIPEELRRLNWIDFQDDARFDDHIAQLVDALETDIEWIRRHTQF